MEPMNEYEEQQAESETIAAWLYSEDVIERDIRRAAQAARRADGSLWVAGYFAARVLGLYRANAIHDIAQQAGRDPSSVQNWAHAWELYAQLRSHLRTYDVRRIRKLLTISHFAVAWELQRKYNYTLEKTMYYLMQMIAYRENGESYSVQSLRAEVEATEERSGNSPTWEYYRGRLGKLYAALMVLDDVPHAVRRWLADAPEEVR